MVPFWVLDLSRQHLLLAPGLCLYEHTCVATQAFDKRERARRNKAMGAASEECDETCHLHVPHLIRPQSGEGLHSHSYSSSQFMLAYRSKE